MNIVLIRPRPSPETIGLQHVMICEPLELEYLSASINDLGHTTTIVDMILERKSLARILQRLQPDLVAITGYITHVLIIKEYCRTTKSLFPNCHTVVGGVHAEVVPEDFQDPAIDFIVRADGIGTFRVVVQALAGGRSPEAGGNIWSPHGPGGRKPMSFKYPFPDREKVARYRSRYYYLFHNPCALIKTSFGCPFTCEFCFCREITGHRYFERDLDGVIAELKTIPQKDVYIVDDNFLVSRDRVTHFCEALQAEKIDKRFLIYGRADFIADNEDVIRLFKSRGLRAVIVGLESCVTGELDAYNKKSDVSANEAAVKILADHQIDCYATLILGIDWQKADFQRLERWLKKLKLTFINLQPFTPLPGTNPYPTYESQLIVPREAFAQWDLAHLVLQPTHMSAAAYYWQIIRLYHCVTLHPRNTLKLIRDHGLRANLRLFMGSLRVTWQYLRKMVGSWRNPNA
ncbi:MAG: cobalamin-dependent protein [Lentisphaeria bacterium]|nr:cobalamin-dependent protein [Lentisphaeria bacterium]